MIKNIFNRITHASKEDVIRYLEQQILEEQMSGIKSEAIADHAMSNVTYHQLRVTNLRAALAKFKEENV